MFGWWKTHRRRQRASRPFPISWQEAIQSEVRLTERLPAALRPRWQGLIQVFVAEKHWEGCGGLTLTPEMQAIIAAQACLLLAGFEDWWCFDRLATILVYPDAYAREHHQGPLVAAAHPIEGESWQHGPIVLNWASVLEDAQQPQWGRNLVLHEFAHQIDGLDSDVDGLPPLSQVRNPRAAEILRAEADQLAADVRQGRGTLLDPYGATNPAEFFAVTTECFFTRPAALRARRPELYEVLSELFRLDPADW